MSSLFSLIPTTVALGLLLYGLAGYEPTLPRNLWLFAASILVGPVAVTLLGLVGWLLMVTAAALALVGYAASRRPLGG
jgi:hypothetical protein